ncbi:hypothetical protein BJV77DRAFT_687128 [Russula vinacea]|nr:hypothetical protein BJV77DRAFT_687128 [Russula vinacea]
MASIGACVPYILTHRSEIYHGHTCLAVRRVWVEDVWRVFYYLFSLASRDRNVDSISICSGFLTHTVVPRVDRARYKFTVVFISKSIFEDGACLCTCHNEYFYSSSFYRFFSFRFPFTVLPHLSSVVSSSTVRTSRVCSTDCLGSHSDSVLTSAFTSSHYIFPAPAALALPSLTSRPRRYFPPPDPEGQALVPFP